MQRMTNRLREQPDRGASAIIVALSLMVLLGFTGFGIDVGSAYAKSQEVQNAADAAALATAQHCAKKDSNCVEGSRASQATDLSEQNIIRLEDVGAYDTYPASNRVTVEVTAKHQNFFAGIFGFDSFTIVREATAEWESPSAGPATLPLTVSACTFFEQSKLDPEIEPPPGTKVIIYQPQGAADDAEECGWHKEYPPGGFGWLGDGSSCEVPIDLSSPWVGGKTGISVPGCVVDMMSQLNGSNSVTVLVPIFNEESKVRPPGYSGPDYNRYYKLVRFAALEVTAMGFQTGSPKGYPSGFECVKPPKGYSKTCLEGNFVSWVDLGDEFDGGEGEGNVSIVRLVDPDFVYSG